MGDEPDKRVSRRGFLKVSAVGAAAAGLAVAAPAALSAVGNAAAESPGSGLTVPVMAYVRDASRGEIVVMWGTRETVRRDPALVARILQYSSG
ncbi:MAG TPA: twin-arginine translocation signal domain-containing protein [Thermoplasmata archaeon]|jgi:anaerobic selenocysteine-containing dehydrogenase|nr:twin-arginine translocation signal domain-containing protein [Thermoplasmata archaeon]